MSEHESSNSLSQQASQHDGASQPQQSNQHSQAPPYNPLPFYNTQVGSSLGHSVVPDLMKVYESLTHSSTPQVPAPQQTMSAPPNLPPSQYSQQPVGQQQPQQQYQSGQYPQPNQHYVSSQPPPGQQPQYQQHTQFVQPQQQAYYTRSQDPSYGQQQGNAENADGRNEDPSVVSSGETVTSRGRRSRKRSLDDSGSDSAGHTKGRKKGSPSDGRWSKRFTWPEDLHRDFVSAIFDVGLKHSSPSALLEFMPKHDQITSERIKSHLQKYRLHREKSRKEFMSSYDATLGKFQMSGVDSSMKSLSSGEVASHLAYSTMMEVDEITHSNQDATKEGSGEVTTSQSQQGGVLHLPKLTEAEKQSPIGASMGYLMGLFFSLRQQLMQQRAEAGYTIGTPGTQAPVVVTDTGSTSTTLSAGQAYGAVGSHQQPHQQQVPRADLSVTWSTHSGQDAQQPPQARAAHPDGGSQEAGLVDGKLISPSTRSNVEENNLMKREMQNQMAFQNKMRALKQQELNKYRNVAVGQQQAHDSTKDGSMEGGRGEAKAPEFTKSGGGDTKDAAAAEGENRSQYAGQTAGGGASTSKDARGISFGGPEDFWNSGDVDDHLFEFLMNS